MMILLWRIAILLLVVIVGVVSPASGAGADGDNGAPATPTVFKHTKTIKYSNGDTYLYSDGDSYLGKVDDNGLKSGHGIFVWENGDFYEGDWLEGKRHGMGKHTWADGSVYEGDWLDDKRHGMGKLTWADGSVYNGEFKDDLRNGFGTETSRWKLLRYQGEWSNDKKHGKGAESWFGNLIEIKGELKDGRATSLSRVRVDIDVRVLFLVMAVLTIMREFHLRDLKGTKSTGGVDVVHVERDDTDDTDTHLVVRLDSDYSHCSICYQAFTTNMERTDQTSRELLPVLGLCGHYFCHSCIIGCNYMVRRSSVGCPKCSKADQFVPTSPLYHRMLIDLLHRARPIGTGTASDEEAEEYEGE